MNGKIFVLRINNGFKKKTIYRFMKSNVIDIKIKILTKITIKY